LYFVNFTVCVQNGGNDLHFINFRGYLVGLLGDKGLKVRKMWVASR